MSLPGLPVVDVREAAKRLEPEGARPRPLMVDVRNPDEFESVFAPITMMNAIGISV